MADALQATRLQADAWDDFIDRWISFHRSRVYRDSGRGYDDWHEEEVKRSAPLTDVSVGVILEHAIGIEPDRWSRADQMRVTAWLKANGWSRHQVRTDSGRQWRYRR